MALYSTLQKFITKEGAPVEGASVNVKLSGGAVDAELFATRTGTAKSNPFLTTANGEALCYAKAGRYDMTVTKGTDQIVFKDIEVGPVSNVGTFAEGGTITDTDQLVEDAGGNKWRWTGNLNYTFAAGENPNDTAEWEVYSIGNLRPFDSIADMKQAKQLLYMPSGTVVRWLGYYAKSDGGSNWGLVKRGDHTEDGGSIFSIDSNTYIEANLKAKRVSVEKFGAVGGGSMEDTDRIKNALSSAVKEIKFSRGKSYIATETLSSSLDGRVISGYGAKVTLSGSSIGTAVMMSGDDSKCLGLTVDCNQAAHTGVNIEGDSPEIKHCKVINVFNASGGAYAIRTSSLLATRIERNEVHNVMSEGDSVTGNSVGASRAIFIGWSGGDREEVAVVANNTISNVLGEEGDAIHVQGTDVTPFRKGLVKISNNQISRCTRRAIKIQASNCLIKNNTYKHELPRASSINFAAAIEVINGGGCHIESNNLDAIEGVGIVYGGTIKVAGGSIKNNTIVTGYKSSSDSGWNKGSQRAILAIDIDDLNISDNKCTGGLNSIEADKCNRVEIKNNTVMESSGSGNAGVGISIGSTCKNPTITNNTGGSPLYKRVYFVRTGAPNSVVVNNHVKYLGQVDSSYGCVNISSTAVNSYVAGNSSHCNVFQTVTGSISSDSVVVGNVNLGAGVNGGDDLVTRIRSVPSTPNSAGKEGEVSITSSHLYVCVGENNWVRSPLSAW